MKTYPISTGNQNVPKNAFLIAETYAMSGEITTTYYADEEGCLWGVIDWKGNKPFPVYLPEINKLTGDPVSILYSRIANHFKTSFGILVEQNIFNKD